MKTRVKTWTLAIASVALASVVSLDPIRAQSNEDALIKRARGIHDRVIALDTHDDINPGNFMLSLNYTQDLGTQVNLPKMKKGGLDAAFFIVYVGQSNPATAPDAFERAGYQRAYDAAIEKFEAIHRLTKLIAPDQIELALTADDVRRINAKGKKIALIGVENGYPLGDETTAISRVKEFYDRGARYLSLAHNGHSQLADSNTGEASGQWSHNGLSELGKRVVAELNRWGIMVDISHPRRRPTFRPSRCPRHPSSPRTQDRARCAMTAATWTTSCCWRSRRTAA